MNIAHRQFVLLCTLGLFACSGSTVDEMENGSTGGQPVVEDVLPISADPAGSLARPEQLPNDPGLAETMADSGLQVTFATAVQRQTIDPLYIEQQWLQMQTCLGVTAAPPMVSVMQGAVVPIAATDDVVRYIDGSIVATASVGVSSTQLQISDADFDGSIGPVGQNLRSIMARHLWLFAGLAERDYPHECIRT